MLPPPCQKLKQAKTAGAVLMGGRIRFAVKDQPMTSVRLVNAYL
jgi:hypothetical protein